MFYKRNILLIGLCVLSALLLVKLFVMQIINDRYKEDAIRNASVRTTIYPPRGIIYDRNGEIVVSNKVVYDLMVTPKEIKEFDTLALASILNVSTEYIESKLTEYNNRRKKIGYGSEVLLRKLSRDMYMSFAERSYMFPGFHGRARYVRDYPFEAGGNLWGYISGVDEEYMKSHPNEYRIGDYAGKTGIEYIYEQELKGQKGYNIWIRDSHNTIKSRYKDGAEDKDAIPGKDITTTIDIQLQAYGELLMNNKKGSLIAIEPSSGEILTMVSSPVININHLEDLGRYYNEIVSDPQKPMLNRAVQAVYPPGSVFKIVNGLIGLEEEIVTPETKYPCYSGYHFGRHKVGCHMHKSPIDFKESLMMSCNAYYCYLFRGLLEDPKYSSYNDAMDKWHDYVSSLGLGQKLGVDIPSEQGGFVPDSKYYSRSGAKYWKPTEVISLSIGQGELGCTPLQLANLSATVANRGYYYTPHIVKDSGNLRINPKYKERHYTLIDSLHFSEVIRGMYLAVNAKRGLGATAGVAAVDGLNICGKTGTAQNSHGKDHSIFVCFAPMDNPKIAVAAYVENAGYGAEWAAPIASLLVEKYLTGSISNSRKPLETKIINGKIPIS